MPDNTQTTSVDNSISAIVAEAKGLRDSEVRKELVKKYKVIAKRRGQLAAHSATFDKKVAEFEAAIAAATNPEQQMMAVEGFKFPAKSIHFTPAQDD